MSKKEDRIFKNNMNASDEQISNDQDLKKNEDQDELKQDVDDETSQPDKEVTESEQSDSGDEKNDKTPEQKIKELEEEVTSLKDRLLRKQADYENFRKRLYREKEESMKYANQVLLLDIVSMIDDFERAMKSAEDSKDFDAFHKGIVMIEKQLVSILEKKWELKRYDSVGEVFDPDRHLAIAAEENEDVKEPTVIEDYQKGYLFHERVLRPAKVKVSQPMAKDKNNSDENNQESDNDKE